MRAHYLAHLAELRDPERVAYEIERTIGAFAGHKEVAAPEEGLIFQPVDIETINSNCVVLAIDDNTFEPALLIEAHLIAQALVCIASLNNLNGVSI